MARPKEKEGKLVSFSIEKTLAERLDKFCKKTGITKTRVVEMSLKYFLDQNEKLFKDL